MKNTMQCEYSSNFDNVNLCCNRLKEFIDAHSLQKSWFKYELLAREALNNAVIHGSGVDGNFRFFVELEDNLIVLRIWDNGTGESQVSVDENVEREKGQNTTGRGFLILEKYAKDYNINNYGNEIEIKIEVE